ncbi:MAG: AAA family ATPase [Pseudomonadota bacterium]
MATLIAMSGLPGVGKTVLSRVLARRTGAVHLRVDTAEAALQHSTLRITQAEDAGYRVLAGLAIDNLRLGLDVIADTVNPIALTRQIWAEAAATAGADLLNVEVTCQDATRHRFRVEGRQSDLPGQTVPTWAAVQNRYFQLWWGAALSVDTGEATLEACAQRIAAAMGGKTG